MTELSKSDLPHHAASFDTPPTSNNIFESLSTRWIVKPFHFKPPTGRPQTDKTEEPSQDRTEVSLTIDFQFSNPIYAALSKAVAPKVAGIMIEAFEVRAKHLLGGSGSSIKDNGSLGDAVRAGQKMNA